MQKPLTNRLNIVQHLAELRRRIIYCFIFLSISWSLCYYFSERIYNFLLIPLAKLYPNNLHSMIYTSLTEAFFTYLKLAIYFGNFISMPFIITQIYIFVAPGLYKNEKSIILPYLLFAPILFILGAVFAYTIVIPIAWKFLISFETIGGNSIMPIKFEARISR